jgi:hypothetical protein
MMSRVGRLEKAAAAHTGVERANATEDEFGAKLKQTNKRLYKAAGKAVEKTCVCHTGFSSGVHGGLEESQFPCRL